MFRTCYLLGLAGLIVRPRVWRSFQRLSALLRIAVVRTMCIMSLHSLTNIITTIICGNCTITNHDATTIRLFRTAADDQDEICSVVSVSAKKKRPS